MNNLIFILLIGTGATLLMDLWGLVRSQLFHIAAPDYGMVGRWIAHMRHGRFYHKSISASPPVAGERVIGWISHYVIGISFAAILIGIWGYEWVAQPKPGPAIAVGLGTLIAPFLLMQPGMGAGIAASKNPNPTSARINSLGTHLVFGVGLYASAYIIKLVCPIGC